MADRFDVLERRDHLRALLEAVHDYAQVVVRDTASFVPVTLHNETGLLKDAAADITAAFSNAVDQMMEDAAIQAA